MIKFNLFSFSFSFSICFIFFLLSNSFCSRVIPSNFSFTFQNQYSGNLIPCFLANGSEVNVTVTNQNTNWWYIENNVTHTGIESSTGSSPTAINLNLNSSSFSIEIWFSNINQSNNILINDESSSRGSYYPVISIGSNTSSLRIGISSQGSFISKFTVLTPDLSNGDYYHLIVNWEIGNQSVYLNNIKIGFGNLSKNISNVFPIDTLQFEHLVYYVGSYERILTSEEIKGNYEAGIPAWFNQSRNTLTLNDSQYSLFDFNDFYLLSNSSIYEISITSNNSNSSYYYCNLYSADSGDQIKLNYTLPINSSKINILAPIQPNQSVQCLFGYTITFVDLNYKSSWKHQSELIIDVRNVTGGPGFYPFYFELNLSSLENQSFAIDYKDGKGNNVINFTISSPITNGIIYYNGKLVSNGITSNISSASNSGNITFDYIMTSQNNDNSPDISFNLTLGSDSGYSRTNQITLKLNSSNLEMNKGEGNITEDYYSPINLTFTDLFSGNLSSIWEIVWIGENISNSSIRVNNSDISMGDVITKGDGTSINEANPLLVYIRAPLYYFYPLELSFMMKNGEAVKNFTIVFDITKTYHQSTIQAICYDDCENNNNNKEFIYQGNQFMISFDIFDPDETELIIRLSLTVFEMKSSSFNETQNKMLNGSKKEIDEQLANFTIITNEGNEGAQTDYLVVNLTNTEKPEDFYLVKYEISVPQQTTSNNVNNTIPIAVGASVGGFGLVLIVVLVVLVVRRKKNEVKAPPPPDDFGPYVYGEKLYNLQFKGENAKKMESIRDLEELIFTTADSLRFISGMLKVVKVYDMDSVCRAVTYLAVHNNLFKKLIEELIKDEVEKTEQEYTLFRLNTPSSKISIFIFISFLFFDQIYFYLFLFIFIYSTFFLF
ncbi:hypothetical protein M0811_11326 [Anaeramoeba ignava]|uniref:Uncharacterized protein n=1 Tax=Anaeramoeba ignava TaxID=1746090 RepID=A0A9Q0LC48_ANAIG|nr:hypothetical protein M0811_11326 [Anaeramoeba ignava]